MGRGEKKEQLMGKETSELRCRGEKLQGAWGLLRAGASMEVGTLHWSRSWWGRTGWKLDV